MSIPYLGYGAYLGSGEESVYGTAVARDRWTRVNSVGIRRARTKQTVDDITSVGSTFPNVRHVFTASDRVSGSFVFNASYDSTFLQRQLYHAMGAVNTSGTGPYTHVYTTDLDLPAGQTLEQGAGNSYAEVFEGCKVNRLTLDVEPGRLMTCSVDVIGETSGGPTTQGSPSQVANPVWINPVHGGQFTFNSVSYTIKRFQLTIDNKLSERDQIGSLETLEPARTARAEYTIQVVLERVSNALHTAYLNDTQADAQIVFQNIPAAKSITFDLMNAMIMEYDPPAVSQVGPLEESVTFRGFADSSDGGLQITLVNGNSAA